MWTDIFTGKKYEKGEYEMCCPLEYFPVFAREGAIIPMLPERDDNSTDFTELAVSVYSGENDYTLYDDDGESVRFILHGETIEVIPSENSRTKKVTVTFKDSEKEDREFIFE